MLARRKLRRPSKLVGGDLALEPVQFSRSFFRVVFSATLFEAQVSGQ
ncbi:MAG: hypothetical protein RIR10_1453 [Planctomycetota bacterium]|jgi:hypothetical protein